MPNARFSHAKRSASLITLLAIAVLLGACSGGNDSGPPPDSFVDPNDPGNCIGFCANTNTFLTVTDVQNVIARGVAEAQARNVAATIAVTDRVGNVLAVFQMANAGTTVTITSTTPGQTPISGGLDGLSLIPSAAAAISKAITGAYLSNEKGAFSSRTASMIVQSHFAPGELLTPGGPLSGVQFSQLPCSDLSNRFSGAPGPGPQRSPLGLSADPGGFPLYKAGTVVGGVGVSADGIYSLDPNIQDINNNDIDEAIALAATFGLGAPNNRRAEVLTVDGKSLRFSDVTLADLLSSPQSPPAFSSVVPALGMLIPVPGYTNGVIQQGTAFGQPNSGIRPDVLDYPSIDAFVLVDANNTERFRPRSGTEPAGALQPNEVQAVIANGIMVANRLRSQIDAPQGSQARVTVSVVDSNGTILGIARTRDARIFGIDVSLQKARAAAFFSNANAGATLTSLPDAVYLVPGIGNPVALTNIQLGSYVTAVQQFLGMPTALTDGQVAFSSRAIGGLARPFSPDGVDGNPAGPWAKPAGQWSVFSTGVQLDLAYNALVAHVAFVAQITQTDVGQNCSGVSGFPNLASVTPVPGLANGIQIFSGAVPIYRGNQLVGAVGVSGDGIDQDDAVAFLGLFNGATSLSNSINHAPMNMRADQLAPSGPNLRYVSCPQAPFIDNNQEEVCRGI